MGPLCSIIRERSVVRPSSFHSRLCSHWSASTRVYEARIEPKAGHRDIPEGKQQQLQSYTMMKEVYRPNFH